MTAEDWRVKIKEACEMAGTYQPCFDIIIDELAEILERRDEADEVYKKTGSKPVIKHTNKGGATNLAKHPALTLWMDLKATALAYWRDLGLTPSGLKKLNEQAIAPKRVGALAKAISDIGKEL